MDASIGHLQLVGRVAGATDYARRDEVVDLLTGASARRRLLEALTTVFDGDEVLVIRSLACTTTLRHDARAGPDALARSITASVARLLREHPTDDDCVVRFTDTAAYVAAYVHDSLDGHHDRWYYHAFEPYRRRDGSSDWSALLAAHRPHRWRILARVRRNGDLDTLIGSLGDDRTQEIATDLVGGGNHGWSPLVKTAADIVGCALDTATMTVDPRTAPALAQTEPQPDWRDPTSLGGAVAAAAAAILSTSTSASDKGAGDIRNRLLSAARQHDWFDQAAFTACLSARWPDDTTAGRAEPAALEPVLSSRARQVLADLATVVADPHLFLDPGRPTSGANVVRLVAALIQVAPQWDDDDLASSVVLHVLRHWETHETRGAATGPPPPTTPERHPPTPLDSPSDTVADPGKASKSQPPHGPVPEPPAVTHHHPDPPPLSTRSVAELLEHRFPRPDQPNRRPTSQTAAGLMLLRGLLDLGLSPYLLDPVGGSREPMLAALLRRWSGLPHPPVDDPLLNLVAQVADDSPGRRDRLDDVCRLTVSRLLGQRLATAPFSAVTVPYGAAALATVAVDGSGHLLPLGALDGLRSLEESSAAAGLSLDDRQVDAETRASLTDVLASVFSTPSGDQLTDLVLDLLAVSCVQAWARWLPGFTTATVPFLLTTVVRRPAAFDVGPTDVTVLLPPRPHDIVLQLAGYFDPVEAGPVLGGRRLSFVKEDHNGA